MERGYSDTGDRVHGITLSWRRTWKIKMNNPCRVLRIVKIHANMTVFSLTVNNPNSQVSPSSGRRMREALTVVLYTRS